MYFSCDPPAFRQVSAALSRCLPVAHFSMKPGEALQCRNKTDRSCTVAFDTPPPRVNRKKGDVVAIAKPRRPRGPGLPLHAARPREGPASRPRPRALPRPPRGAPARGRATGATATGSYLHIIIFIIGRSGDA